MNPVPNTAFRNHLENALELHLQSEARDYLNHLWLEAPDSFDVDLTLAEFIDYIDDHFRMVWIYTDTED